MPQIKVWRNTFYQIVWPLAPGPQWVCGACGPWFCNDWGLHMISNVVYFVFVYSFCMRNQRNEDPFYKNTNICLWFSPQLSHILLSIDEAWGLKKKPNKIHPLTQSPSPPPWQSVAYINSHSESTEWCKHWIGDDFYSRSYEAYYLGLDFVHMGRLSPKLCPGFVPMAISVLRYFLKKIIFDGK